jgi:hypothetical protein
MIVDQIELLQFSGFLLYMVTVVFILMSVVK